MSATLPSVVHFRLTVPTANSNRIYGHRAALLGHGECVTCEMPTVLDDDPHASLNHGEPECHGIYIPWARIRTIGDRILSQ